jgi:ubiquinone biosynthesis protein
MRDNLGPKAIARDLRDTAVVLARYTPRLPGIAEKFVIRADAEADVTPPPPPPSPLLAGIVGGFVGAAAVLAVAWLLLAGASE